MAKKPSKPKFLPVDADDLKPLHQWHRPLQAPGITQVDFEERVNFPRLHLYRLARTRQALANSGLGAMLCFDQHNIRYIDRKSTRLNSSHSQQSRMPSSA